MGNKSLFWIFLFLLVLNTLFLAGMRYYDSNHYTIEEVDCYDLKDNKIQDITCENEVGEIPSVMHLFSLLISVLLAFATGFFFPSLERI